MGLGREICILWLRHERASDSLIDVDAPTACRVIETDPRSLLTGALNMWFPYGVPRISPRLGARVSRCLGYPSFGSNNAQTMG
jgi:hypothetical protein